MRWMPIDDFPGYSVSDEGQVRNDDTGRILVLTRNQRGIVQVGLMQGGRQLKRSVAVLVSKAFIDPAGLSPFSTPIHLNGDRLDTSVENLTLRPLWFARKYHEQFDGDHQSYHKPVIEMETKEEFPTMWEAATRYGLLLEELYFSILNRTYVFPTYQQFKWIAE